MMSVEEAFYLARIARTKLLSKASEADPSLRQLLGHANLLDSLLLVIAIPPHAQNITLSDPVSRLAKTIDQKRMLTDWDVTILDEIEEDLEEDDSEDTDDDSHPELETDSDSDSDSDRDAFSDEGEYEDLQSALSHHNVFITNGQKPQPKS
jgi:hypothetical protein